MSAYIYIPMLVLLRPRKAMAFRPIHAIVPSRLLMPRAQPLETILQGIHQFIETLEKFVPQWEIPAKVLNGKTEWEKTLPQTELRSHGIFP